MTEFFGCRMEMDKLTVLFKADKMTWPMQRGIKRQSMFRDEEYIHLMKIECAKKDGVK